MTRNLNYPPMTDIAKPRVEDRARGTAWPEEEIQFLRNHHRKFKNKVLAEHLRRSENAVKIMVCRIRKRDAEKASETVSRETQAAE